MPKAMCPLCGASSHVNTSFPREWEERYPELFIVNYAGRLCHNCFPNLSEGDPVTIRDADPPLAGHVERVANCTGGLQLFLVRFESGGRDTYPRNRLTKVQSDDD
jgi:hypothetical protein